MDCFLRRRYCLLSDSILVVTAGFIWISLYTGEWIGCSNRTCDNLLQNMWGDPHGGGIIVCWDLWSPFTNLMTSP